MTAPVAIPPDVDTSDPRLTAYLSGHNDGSIAGTLYTHTGRLPGRYDEFRLNARRTSLVPLPLDVALRANARYPQWREQGSLLYGLGPLQLVGFLQGWKEFTEGHPQAVECAACSRRLLPEFDEIRRCAVTGDAVCADDADCWHNCQSHVECGGE